MRLLTAEAPGESRDHVVGSCYGCGEWGVDGIGSLSMIVPKIRCIDVVLAKAAILVIVDAFAIDRPICQALGQETPDPERNEHTNYRRLQIQ